jgi:hypothetical protein
MPTAMTNVAGQGESLRNGKKQTKQSDIWGAFCAHIIKCNRFFLPHNCTFNDMLSCVGGAANYRHPVDRPLYRGRMSSSNIMYECYEAVQMLAPSPECTPDGRANVCGIPVLYAAEAERTVVAELRGWKGAKLHIVTLKPLRELNLVDLSRCDVFSAPHNEDDPGQTDTPRALMLRLDAAFSKPYSDSDSKVNYVPTQYVASYYKAAGFDGIRYSSAMDTGGHNVAIFDTQGAVEPRQSVRRFTVEAIEYQARSFIPFHERPGYKFTLADEP